ncbi:MAG: TVP38/TMEM64 family protein, partial [Rubrivivax sp.]
MTRPSRTLLWAGAFLLALVATWAWRAYDLGSLLTLEHLKTSRDALQARVQAQPLETAGAFFAVYVAATALSIPGAVILTLAAGAMFGLGWGLLLVSFASSVGALLAFLVARHLLREAVQARLGQALAPINEGVRRDGTLYLLTLRLVPVFPFWLINLLMGLTPMGAGRFYVVSQIGMLAGTAVYVNAGTQLAAIRSPGDIVSPALLGSFVLLGLFPLLAKAG